MDSLTFVKERLARLERGQFKAVSETTGVNRMALWRIATGRTVNPGIKHVEALKRYFEAAA